MPTYEYECKSCGHDFEIFQSMKDPPIKECPKCGQEIRRLIFGGTGVIFKGSGFYVTDKSKSSGKSTANAGKTEAKTEPKTDASPCNSCPNKDASDKCSA
ncbi:MAG: hypothetical protein FWC21_04040 [Treponema sp.]|nr:hypothetical protein [Treponema sp.]